MLPERSIANSNGFTFNLLIEINAWKTDTPSRWLIFYLGKMAWQITRGKSIRTLITTNAMDLISYARSVCCASNFKLKFTRSHLGAYGFNLIQPCRTIKFNSLKMLFSWAELNDAWFWVLGATISTNWKNNCKSVLEIKFHRKCAVHANELRF